MVERIIHMSSCVYRCSDDGVHFADSDESLKMGLFLKMTESFSFENVEAMNMVPRNPLKLSLRITKIRRGSPYG